MSWIVPAKPDLSMMLNGAVAALVAITAASGFVAPWAAIVIGLVAGGIVVLGIQLIERIRIDDPIGAISAHGMAGVWDVGDWPSAGAGASRRTLPPELAVRLHGELLHQLGAEALGLLVVGACHLTTCFAALWIMKATSGSCRARGRRPGSTSPNTHVGLSRFYTGPRAATGPRVTLISYASHVYAPGRAAHPVRHA